MNSAMMTAANKAANKPAKMLKEKKIGTHIEVTKGTNSVPGAEKKYGLKPKAKNPPKDKKV